MWDSIQRLRPWLSLPLHCTGLHDLFKQRLLVEVVALSVPHALLLTVILVRSDRLCRKLPCVGRLGRGCFFYWDGSLVDELGEALGWHDGGSALEAFLKPR